MAKEILEKSVCIASILLLAVLLFLLFSISVPAGRNKEVGYGGFTSAFVLKNIFIMFYAVSCAQEIQCLHIF